MDVATENRVINNVLSLDYKQTIIVSTHRTNHLMMLDKIAVMADGKLIQYGPTESIIKQSSANEGNS